MTIVLGKVDDPRGEELSTVTGIEEVYWKSTCEKCEWRGNRLAEQDWIQLTRSGYVKPGLKEKQSFEIDRFPKRCRECSTKAKRFTRMKNSLDKLVDIKRHLEPRDDQVFSRLKMITITNKNNLDKKEFKKRFLNWRNNSSYLIGGTYVLEQGSLNGMWHMHGVFIAPYIEKKFFDDLTLAKSGEHYGLGNVHYQEAQLEKESRSRHLENYIAKYMCKDGNRKQSFGALYRCEREIIEDIDKNKVARIWKQPNVQKYRKQMNEWKGL